MGNLDNPTANQIALERAIYQKGFGDGFTASKKEIPTERCQKCGAWKKRTADFDSIAQAICWMCSYNQKYPYSE